MARSDGPMSLAGRASARLSARCPAISHRRQPSSAGRRIVAPDVERVDVNLQFDVAAREATGEAGVLRRRGSETGHPALDLRQPIDWLRLDGDDLDPDAFAPLDLGAGPGVGDAGPRRQPGSGHPPPAPARATGWRPPGGGGRADRLDRRRACASTCGCPTSSRAATWRCGCRPRSSMTGSPSTSELALRGHAAPHRGGQHGRCRRRHRGRALVAALPRPLHRPVADAGHGPERRGRDCAAARWTCPDRERSLEPGLRPAPPRSTPTWRPARPTSSPGWRTTAARYGPWVHGDTFWAFVWGHGRGMEYDGATTASVPALEHEVFHSWFGRGVKPARAADGWIDEAWTTLGHDVPPAGQPRFAVRGAAPSTSRPSSCTPSIRGPGTPRWRPTPRGPPLRRPGLPLRRSRAAALRHGRVVPGQRRPLGDDRRPGRPPQRLVRGRHQPVVGPVRARPRRSCLSSPLTANRRADGPVCESLSGYVRARTPIGRRWRWP